MATAQDLIDETRRIIHDETEASFRWSDAELLDYLNAGTRQVVVLLPEANTVEELQSITNRTARQDLPAGGIKFVKVAHNFNSSSERPGAVVRYVEKDALDTYYLDWEEDTSVKSDQDNFFEHYCHDDREPQVYYLYPPNPLGSRSIMLIYVKNPTALDAVTDDFPLDDEYINGVIQYMIYRALTKEARDTLPSAFRQELWNNFLSALGLQRQALDTVAPDAAGNKPPDAG